MFGNNVIISIYQIHLNWFSRSLNFTIISLAAMRWLNEVNEVYIYRITVYIV